MIECSVRSGEAQFSYHGLNVNQTRGSNAAVVIKEKTLLSGHFAMEGQCNGLFHYLFLKNGEHYISLKVMALSPLIIFM